LKKQLEVRTRELAEARGHLSEALEQQTATSEVLRVISRSAADIQPVFEIIGERAEKLCDAEISVVSMVDGEVIRLASIHGVTKEGIEAVRRVFPMHLDDETVTARAIRTRSVCHVPDVLGDPEYQNKEPRGRVAIVAALACRWSVTVRWSEQYSWRAGSRVCLRVPKFSCSKPSPTRQ
jgi:hypothetical protein